MVEYGWGNETHTHIKLMVDGVCFSYKKVGLEGWAVGKRPKRFDQSDN